MKEYAIFLSLTDNYAYLFNALLNSIELFGIGKYADVVVIHDDSIGEEYRSLVEEKTKDMDTDVIFAPIVSRPIDKDLGKVMTVKYYRYKMMAEIGQQYKAICFIDTDIYLASGIKEYFDIVSSTDLIVGVNDNVVRHYKNNTNMGTCPAWYEEGKSRKDLKPVFDHELWDGKFICNTPLFLDARKYGHLLMDVYEQRKKIGMDNTWPFTGDLETMNIVFNKHGVKNRLLVLASHLWTGVHYSIYRTTTIPRLMTLSSNIRLSDEDSHLNKVLFMSDTQEHVRAFHGRDWTCQKNEERIKDHNIPKLLGQMEGTYDESHKKRREIVFDTIQAYFLFLQFDCNITLDDLIKVISVPNYEYLKAKRKISDQIVRKFK